MPYILATERRELDQGRRPPLTAGELSYVITQTIRRWVGPNPDFSVLAAATGVLVLTTMEFMRQVVFKHEDRKKEENGNVY